MIEKWTQVDDTIFKMIRDFPLIFPSRVECWCHLFCTMGTGYEWNLETGNLEYPDSMKKHREKYEHTKGPNLKEIKEDDDELSIFEKKRTNLLRQYDWDNLKTLVKDYYHSTKKQHITQIVNCMFSWSEKTDTYFSPSVMQIACINKEKIAKEWRFEIASFCEFLTGEIRKFTYNPGKDKLSTDNEIIEMLSDTGIRIISDMKTTYICALKVLENIYTEEEKENILKNKAEIKKMIKKLL